MELTKCKLPALKDKAKGHGVGVSKKTKSQLIEAILTAESTPISSGFPYPLDFNPHIHSTD